MKNDILINKEGLENCLHLNLLDVYTSKNRETHSGYLNCDIKVNDIGQLQCCDCRFNFTYKTNRKLIINNLNYRYGEVWEQEYKKLKKAMSMVKAHEYNFLEEFLYIEEDDANKTRIERIYYEAK